MTYTLALRPRAPALVHPQRFLLTIAGEQIVDVEYRPDAGQGSPFVRVDRLGFESLVETAVRTCPTCGIAHGLALCQAIEALAPIQVPARAAVLRVIAAELERAASHLRTAAAIFRALALPTTATTFVNHGLTARAALDTLTGSEPARWLTAGGVSQDLDDDMRTSLEQMASRMIDPLFVQTDRLITSRALLARTVEVGVISAIAAEQFGLTGPLARSSGLKTDLRVDTPYAGYHALHAAPVTQEGGDVYARLVLLILEALESLKLVNRAARELPAGAIRSKLPETLPSGDGESVVEAPRGQLHYRVSADGRRLSAVSCTPAPQLDRLLAKTLLVNTTLDDAALIVVSTDPCDTCLGTRHE